MIPREFAGISGSPYELVQVTLLGDGTLKGRIHGLPVTGHVVDPHASVDEVADELQLTNVQERQQYVGWLDILERLRSKAAGMKQGG
ncbi:hypothetical protein HGP14_30640 [Rhizobium sp. P32RR-XVIII]|uniref:hypothetical protein n=1 Tax=Rhizobium sp. P32RR-XVIII TaxID=2726738 RepID=UPI0014577601|nr:hypothetical protein [Rhizobium sp. P32RR-XVIII]NLS07624.1 hypothetical protein [Rhizobium sp. P32RR-XVIII]